MVVLDMLLVVLVVVIVVMSMVFVVFETFVPTVAPKNSQANAKQRRNQLLPKDHRCKSLQA